MHAAVILFSVRTFSEKKNVVSFPGSAATRERGLSADAPQRQNENRTTLTRSRLDAGVERCLLIDF